MQLRILPAAVLIAALGIPLSVTAQTSGGETAAEQQQFSDQQLRQFAEAYTAILTVQQEYAERLNSVTDRDQAMEIQKQANKEMLQALRGTGMTLDEYRAIATAASQRPELAQRIQSML